MRLNFPLPLARRSRESRWVTFEIVTVKVEPCCLRSKVCFGEDEVGGKT